MAQPGFGAGLDTPRTNFGDATYLSRQPDFDISQEASFQSPSKDANLVQQMRNGGRPTLRTPRGSRAPFADRANMPASMGGAEFTPMLKSATRRSAKRYSGGGKENSVNTPAFLDRIDEDMTPMAAGESSVYGASRNASSYMNNTPLPTADSDSTTTTPMVMRKRGDAKGPLQDGNQLSLREQAEVVDRIEKENFGLKLKIHFLEEALRKAGPGFSEAALKENTELKVDRVTMQRDLQRYKKHLTSAEKELENYRQQMLEVQEKAKRKYADENQRAELERLRQALQEKEDDLEDLRRRFAEHDGEREEVEKLQDEIGSLEADIRRKDNVIGEHEDEIEELKAKAEKAAEQLKDTQRRMLELEEKASSKEELEEARETVDELEVNMRRLEEQLDDAKVKYRKAEAEKERAEADLAELQDEMTNKSLVTKGFPRQVEEKVGRLQDELQRVSEQSALHKAENEKLAAEAKNLRQERDASARMQQSMTAKLEQAQSDLRVARDQEAVLQSQRDKLAVDSASLQRDVGRLEKSLSDVQEDLRQERNHALDIERDVRAEYQDEMDSMRDKMTALEAECREKDKLYDNDSDKWERGRQTLESELGRAEERAAGLQRTVDKLREVEGSLSTKEARLQEALDLETERHKREEALLQRQVQELQQTLEARREKLQELGQELSSAREQLDQSRIVSEEQAARVEALEDEVEVLQATLDDESEQSRHELEKMRHECEALEQQLRALRDAAAADSARLTTTVSQTLQDELAQARTDLQSLRERLAEATAERQHLRDEVQQLRQRGDDACRLDQERLDLRTAKAKLDGEIRRLKDENKALVEQGRMVEKKLEDQLEKAAAEEDRLSQEVLRLQSKLQQPSDSHDARRTIRELERRIEEYEVRLAAGADTDGNSELSLLHRDLTAARHKEVEAAQREASLKDIIKTLRRQVAELERKAHHAELDRLVASPPSSGGSAQKKELSELRIQLSAAQKTVHELKRSLRDAERQSAAAASALQAQLHELHEQNKKQKEKTDRYKAERDHLQVAVRAHQENVNNNTDLSLEERRDLHAMLRESQTTAERLDRQAREMAANEVDLRKKLDRARSERAAYRASAEQLQKDMRKLKTAKEGAAAEAAGAASQALVHISQDKMQVAAGRSPSEIDADAMVRASEAAEKRHEKELRGMVMQMEWLKANWDRQARMRKDAAFAKNYLLLELQVRDACNKTDLAIIDRIRGDLNPRSRTALSMLSANQSRATVRPGKLKRLLTVVRFVVRLRMGAHAWSRHDKVRQRLADCIEGMEREDRIKKKREQWRDGHGAQARSLLPGLA